MIGQLFMLSISLIGEKNFHDVYNDSSFIDFSPFYSINLIYGTVCEQCTDTSCPTMSGGPKYEYLWQDGQKYKKPVHLPANQVI